MDEDDMSQSDGANAAFEADIANITRVVPRLASPASDRDSLMSVDMHDANVPWAAPPPHTGLGVNAAVPWAAPPPHAGLGVNAAVPWSAAPTVIGDGVTAAPIVTGDGVITAGPWATATPSGSLAREINDLTGHRAPWAQQRLLPDPVRAADGRLLSPFGPMGRDVHVINRYNEVLALAEEHSREDALENASQEASTSQTSTKKEQPKSVLTDYHLKTLDSRGWHREREAVDHALKLFSSPPLAGLIYSLRPSQTGTDVWPDMKDFSRTPAFMTPLATDMTSKEEKSAVPPFRHLRRAISPPRKHPEWLHQESTSRPKRNPTWPQHHTSKHLLPLEVYELIVDHLARDDIKALRLTCTQIEWHVSHFLFKTVVVPFNTEIYGMLKVTQEIRAAEASRSKTSRGKALKDKGKQKASQPPSGSSLVWKNTSSSDVYNGHALDIFRSFGPHMKRFGMTFEVDEEMLAALPRKELVQELRSYWGEYEWPFPEYQRFKEVSSLEDTADETNLMAEAFYHLTQVEELALSVDAGTGFLLGPDVSLYHRIFTKPSPVFKSKFPVPERRAQAQQYLWDMLKGLCSLNEGENIANADARHRLIPLSNEAYEAIQESNSSSSMAPPDPVQLELHSVLDFLCGPEELDHLKDILSSGSQAQDRTNTPCDMRIPDTVTGILAFDVPEEPETQRNFQTPLVPNNLTKFQREWLLETAWAQRAFIASYIMAIMDNPRAFANVHTLTLSKISSSYLPLLNREDFWDSLPSLKHVTVLVIGEWQNVYKDEAGYVEVATTCPSRQSRCIEDFLSDMIASRRNIKSLNIGWASGGENATGVYGRNANLSPCPLMPSKWRSNMAEISLLANEMILFPFLEHITLTNCWIVPTVLQLLVKRHCTYALKMLTLDSVSLSNHISLLAGALDLEQFPETGEHATIIARHNPLAAPVQPRPPRAPQMQVQMGPAQRGLSLHQARQRLLALTPDQLASLGWTPGQLASAVTDTGSALTPQVMIAIRRFPNGMQQPGPAAPIPPVAPNTRHRNGSWPAILDSISPGLTCGNSNLRIPHPSILPVESKLEVIEIRSCGYTSVTLPRVVHPDDMDTCTGTRHNAKSLRRAGQYSDLMIPGNKDPWSGQISQFMEETEMGVLETVWNMELGWPEESDWRAVMYDGFLPGGTGRFSGSIDKADLPVVMDDDEDDVAMHGA